MTTQRLRDLMEERVADVETDDLASRAWVRADGVRRRAGSLSPAPPWRPRSSSPAAWPSSTTGSRRTLPRRAADIDAVARDADHDPAGPAGRARGAVPWRSLLVGAVRRA